MTVNSVRMTPLPRAAPAVFALAVAGITGCGTLAPDGGPVGQLPSSGAGPYRALDQPSPLLADPAASLDDAVVLVDGEAITIYCTRRDDAGHSTIVRARFTSIDDEAPVIDTALVADRDYEGGSVSQPAVLDLGQGGTLLVYTTGEGTLGYAISSGDGFRKGERPAKRQRPELAEPLSSPALLALDDSQVRLLYLDGDFLYSTDATISSLLPLSGPALREPRPDLPAGRGAAEPTGPGDRPHGDHGAGATALRPLLQRTGLAALGRVRRLLRRGLLRPRGRPAARGQGARGVGSERRRLARRHAARLLARARAPHGAGRRGQPVSIIVSFFYSSNSQVSAISEERLPAANWIRCRHPWYRRR